MYKKAYEEIVGANHILLISHIDPDGDTLGSVLALYDAIKRLNKKVSLYNATKELPVVYNFLPNIEKIKSTLPRGFDLVISCDCGSFDRLGVQSLDSGLINIDHHRSNEMFADINLVDAKSASAGMVVYRLLKENGIRISADCATCIYVTIVEDTGFFSYSNLNKSTFDCVAELVGLGVDANRVATLLKSRVSLAKTRLLGYVLNNFELYFDAKVAFVAVDGDTLLQTGAKRYDTKNMANVLRDIVTVKVSVMILEEKDGDFKVSIRSVMDVDISPIAKEFGGGGHKNAVGFKVKDYSFEKLKKDILDRLRDI